MLALQVYGHRLHQDVCAMAASLGRIDLLVFTASANTTPRCGGARERARVLVIGRVLMAEAREDVEIATQTRARLH